MPVAHRMYRNCCRAFSCHVVGSVTGSIGNTSGFADVLPLAAAELAAAASAAALLLAFLRWLRLWVQSCLASSSTSSS
eukprot:3555412-Alexandrium_andersonii.AAC.1